MIKRVLYILFIISINISCNKPTEESRIKDKTLQSLGTKFKNEFGELAIYYQNKIIDDSTSVDAYVGIVESKVLLYVFGYISRNECMAPAWDAYNKANSIDSLNSNVRKVAGILHYLDWEWQKAEQEFLEAIKLDPQNLNARHWYSLWLISMKRVDESMAQSDTIMSMDNNNDYRIGRASLFYFQHRYEEMKTLMHAEIEDDPSIPWPYDWLGMAYNGLDEHDMALETYYKAFELSDGTVEVGAGLGHALGNAGMKSEAKRMADYYTIASKDNYLPYCQRSFIHISLEEYDQALELLEIAYDEKSWFLIFIQIEHWYDPIRQEGQFQNIMQKMHFPERL